MYVLRKDGAITGVLRFAPVNGEPVEQLPDDHPDVLAFRQKQDAAFAVPDKRAAAVRALEDQRLAQAVLDPAAPQAVKDYAELLRTRVT